MGVYHGRADILMPQKFLNRADVITRLKQMSGERMAERVAPRMLDYIRVVNRIFDSPLKDGFVYMVAALLAGRRVLPAVLLRKDPLPAPVRWSVRILAVQRVGHQDTAPTFGQVFLMDRLDISQMVLKGLLYQFGSIVIRSFAPLPSRTMISLRLKSMS